MYGKCESFVMLMSYVCVLFASCGSFQCCILHDLQFVNVGRGCKRQPYGKDIFQSLCHDCLVGSHECLLLFINLLFVESCVRILKCCKWVCCM